MSGRTNPIEPAEPCQFALSADWTVQPPREELDRVTALIRAAYRQA